MRFKRAYVEITNVCNLSCSFCAGTKREPRFMTVAEFGAALSALRGNCEQLYLHVMGEPLLHPQLSEILETAALQGFPVNLTTNGTLLEACGEVLCSAQALRRVSVSLQSAESAAEREKLLDSVFAFLEKKPADLILNLRLWNVGAAGNEGAFSRLEKYCGVEISRVPTQGTHGTPLGKNTYLNLAAPFEWPDLGAKDFGTEGFCLGLRSQIGVLADGTVVPCCLDHEGNLALGNIFREDLSKILEGSLVREIHAGFSDRKVVAELCRRCEYRTRFG